MYLRDTQDVWEPRNHMLLIVSESTKTQLEASVLQGWQGNPNNNGNDLNTEAFPGAWCPHEPAPQQREPACIRTVICQLAPGFHLQSHWVCGGCRNRNCFYN